MTKILCDVTLRDICNPDRETCQLKYYFRLESLKLCFEIQYLSVAQLRVELYLEMCNFFYSEIKIGTVTCLISIFLTFFIKQSHIVF